MRGAGDRAFIVSIVTAFSILTACAPLHSPTAVSVGATSVTAPSQQDRASEVDWQALELRPLRLPMLAIGDACPVSPVGAAGGFGVTGTGPIYLVGQEPLSFHSTKLMVDGWLFEKYPWLSSPAYVGPALIRGRQLDGPNELHFQRSGRETTGYLPELRFPIETGISGPDIQPGWRFQSGAVGVRGPGCYGVQVDGLTFTESIVFRAST